MGPKTSPRQVIPFASVRQAADTKGVIGLFLLLLGLAVLGVIAQLLRRPAQKSAPNYQSRGELLSPAEAAFYGALQSA